MSQAGASGFGEDRLVAGLGDAVDRARPGEGPVVEDLVFGGPGRRASRSADGLPLHDEHVPLDRAVAMEDGSGDDPLDDDVVGVGPLPDGDSARVLGSVGIDSIDHIGPEDSGALFESRPGETGADGHRGEEGDDPESHRGESTNGTRPIIKWVLGVAGLLVVGVMAFAIFEPVQVLPRVRVGPGFSFVDQAGVPYSSDDTRGVVTLYSFAPTDCGVDCAPMYETMSDVGARVESLDMGGADFRRVTVALDTDDPADLARAAAGSGADGDDWRWIGAPSDHRRDVVGAGFRVFYETTSAGDIEFDPVFVIVDGTGLIRGEYRYASLASDADRLSRHIGLLGDEIRNADGNAALIYEAAHLFLCYP